MASIPTAAFIAGSAIAAVAAHSYGVRKRQGVSTLFWLTSLGIGAFGAYTHGHNQAIGAGGNGPLGLFGARGVGAPLFQPAVFGSRQF